MAWLVTFGSSPSPQSVRRRPSVPIRVVSAHSQPVRVDFRARRLRARTRESNRNGFPDHVRPRVSVELAQCDPGGEPCPSPCPFSPPSRVRFHRRRTGSGPWRTSEFMRTLALSLPGSAPLQAQTRRRPSSERAGRNLVSFFFASVSLKTTHGKRGWGASSPAAVTPDTKSRERCPLRVNEWRARRGDARWTARRRSSAWSRRRG